MNIGITGCGWLGMPLAQSFVQQAHHVVGTTTTPTKLKHLQAQGISAQLFDFDDYSFLKGLDILVFNIPPLAHGKKIEALIPHLPNQTRLLFISSTSVYAAQEEIVTEETILNPQSLSGKILQESEFFLRRELKDRLTILRLAGLVGPGRHPGNFVAGKTLNSPHAPINLIHQQDCLSIIHEIFRQRSWGEVFNAVCDEHTSKQEFYTLMCQLKRTSPPTFTQQHEAFKIISNEKLKKQLSYQFLVPNLSQHYRQDFP